MFWSPQDEKIESPPRLTRLGGDDLLYDIAEEPSPTWDDAWGFDFEVIRGTFPIVFWILLIGKLSMRGFLNDGGTFGVLRLVL